MRPADPDILHEHAGSPPAPRDEAGPPHADRVADGHDVVDSARRAVARSRELRERLAEVGRTLPTLVEQAGHTAQSALAMLGARAVLLYRLVEGDGEPRFVLQSATGVPIEALESIASIPTAGTSLLAETIAGNRVIDCAGGEELVRRWPGALPLASALKARTLRASPLLHLGRPRGVMVLAYERTRELDREHVTMLRTVGAHYARALHTSRLYFDERTARDHAESAQAEAESARRALADAHAVLEHRVVERTSALQEANARLADEVAHRARAEAERNALRAQLARAEESERSRLARELHDQLGAHLTGFSLGLTEVRRRLAAGESPDAWLAQLEELSALLARDARFLALQLRPPELDDVGLESALRTYLSQWSARYGIAADAEYLGTRDGRPITGDAETAVYRIVQEALTNVARHADATQVSLVLDWGERELRLVVEDDGCGFDTLASRFEDGRRRLGIAGMHERARLVGGSLELESAPGEGTSLFVRVPVTPAALDGGTP